MNDQPSKLIHRGLECSALVMIVTLFAPLVASTLEVNRGITGLSSLNLVFYAALYVIFSPIWIYLVVMLLRLPKYSRSTYRLTVALTLVATFLLGVHAFGGSLTMTDSYTFYDSTPIYTLFFVADALVFIFLLSVDRYFPVTQKKSK